MISSRGYLVQRSKKDFKQKKITQFNENLKFRIGFLFDKLYIPSAKNCDMSLSGFDVELIVLV